MVPSVNFPQVTRQLVSDYAFVILLEQPATCAATSDELGGLGHEGQQAGLTHESALDSMECQGGT